MVFNTSFPSLRPLPGVKKTFPGVSAKVNSFREPKSVTNVPAFSTSSTHVPPRDRSARKQVPQELPKKIPVKISVPEIPKLVPFRARPVPASTYKPSFQTTVRKINGSKIEQEQAADKVANTCPSPATVDEPIVEDVVELTCEPPAVVDEPIVGDMVELDACELPSLVDEPMVDDVVELDACEPPAVIDEPTVDDVVELDACEPPAVIDEPTIDDVVELACEPPAVVDEPIVDDVPEIAQPVHEPASEEAKICGTDDPIVEDNSSNDSMGQTSETNIGGARPKTHPPLCPHPTGPGIPPFLPRLYFNNNYTPYVPQPWDYNYTYIPYYYNNCYAYGTFFWDRPMATYHSVSMTLFPEHHVMEQVPPHQAYFQDEYHQTSYVSHVPIGDSCIPQATPDVAPNVPVPNSRKKKPNKAEWNQCYKRRLLRRKNERDERDALKAQRELAEAITPQVPE